MGDGLRLALTTFTVLRVRGPRSLDRRAAGTAMALGPLVGLGLGLVAAAVALVLRRLSDEGLAVELPAVAAVVVLAVLTRGLHLDGLVDTADGLGSYAPAERARAIMKEPGVGALGVVTLVLVLLVQVAALTACIVSDRGTAAIVLAPVVGRLAVLAACTRTTPPAAPGGLGALVSGSVRRGVPALVGLVVVVLAAGVETVDEGGSTAQQAVDAGRAVLAVVLALLVARLLRRHAVRRLGGVTGDVLGALLEVSTTVVLVVMSLELPGRFQPS